MTDEEHTKRLPVALDVLLVCTVTISFFGGMFWLFSIGDYFEEHAPRQEVLGDLLGVLAMCIIFGSHLALVFYLERYVPEELRMPRRVFVVLQIIAIVPVCLITDSFAIDRAIYTSVCSALCYTVVQFLVGWYPAQVNLFFVCLVLVLSVVGLIGKAVGLLGPSPEERATQQAAERRQRQEDFRKEYDALLKEHMDQLRRGKSDFKEFSQETDRLLEKHSEGGYKAPDRTDSEDRRSNRLDR